MTSRDATPIRVLMISPQFRPILGGYERAAERLSGALAAAGLRVSVISERRDPRWPTVEHIDGYEVRRLRCLYRRHLHVHNISWFGAFVTVLAKVLRLPVITKLPNFGNFGIPAMNPVEYGGYAERCRAFAARRSSNGADIEASRQLFNNALEAAS